MNVAMVCTCGACPLQYEGTVDGIPFYYRGRHGRWDFGANRVLDGKEDSAVATAMGFVSGFCRHGAGGDVEPAEAEANVLRCCQELVESGWSPFTQAEARALQAAFVRE